MADPQQLQAQLNALSDAYAAQLPEKLNNIEMIWYQLTQQERRKSSTNRHGASVAPEYESTCASRLPHPNLALRPTVGFAQPTDSCGRKHASRNPAFVPVGGNPHPIPLPEGEGSFALSPSGGKMDRGLRATESLRDFHAKDEGESSEVRVGQVSAEWDWKFFESLCQSVHSLSGSGKTFGFSLLSNVAQSLEQYLNELGLARTPLTAGQCIQIQSLLRELKQVSQHRDASFCQQSELIAVATSGQSDLRIRQIFIVDDDAEFTEELKIQLEYFGFKVEVFNVLNDFRVAIQHAHDVIVLMDIVFPEDNLAGINVIQEIQRGRTAPVPVIFMSDHHDLAARLEAVRAGCVAYLPKPVNVSNLIEKLDALTSSQPAMPYRVLVVDDMPALTSFYATVLEQAGMEVRVVNNPLEVMAPLEEFAPDLILLDIYMPECNGTELARAIRMLDAFVSTPIVFLSVESNRDRQLSAMRLGGDDFLTKPIQADHLVSSVTSRIQRSLLLRSFMVRDGLTGLLNHTAISEQLNREVANFKRQGIPLAFAMVDIDFFKIVNDTYGHPAGDRVIKSLARLLKQRLRENDLVGRYGGEEFAVVLVNADGDTAVKVLDSIRKDFSQLRHLAENGDFTATFSCGVADMSNFDDIVKLCDAADKALYQAKHAGRNLVMLAAAPPN